MRRFHVAGIVGVTVDELSGLHAALVTVVT